MITRRIQVTRGLWESYTIQVGTVINPSSSVTIIANKLYPVEVFYYQQASDYTPHSSSTGLIYSGNIYLGNSNIEVTDICDFVRDQLQYNLFPSDSWILSTYYVAANNYEAPLLTGPKPEWNTNNIFYIYVTDTSTNSTLEIALTVYPHYNPNIRMAWGDLSDPILDIVSPSQLFMVTSSTEETADEWATKLFKLISKDNQETTVDKSVDTTKALLVNNTGIMTSFFQLNNIMSSTSLTDIVEMDYTRYDGSQLITSKYKVDSCIKYVLYYRNLKGGWDWLVVRGSVDKSYKFKKSSYSNDYRLGTYRNFNLTSSTSIVRKSVSVGDVQNDIIYQNDITQELKINLGYFTDEQSKKMINLFSSPLVYIHDILANNICPIKITDNSLKEKKYIDGRAVNKYTIKAELNQKYVIQ